MFLVKEITKSEEILVTQFSSTEVLNLLLSRGKQIVDKKKTEREETVTMFMFPFNRC